MILIVTRRTITYKLLPLFEGGNPIPINYESIPQESIRDTVESHDRIDGMMQRDPTIVQIREWKR